MPVPAVELRVTVSSRGVAWLPSQGPHSAAAVENLRVQSSDRAKSVLTTLEGQGRTVTTAGDIVPMAREIFRPSAWPFENALRRWKSRYTGSSAVVRCCVPLCRVRTVLIKKNAMDADGSRDSSEHRTGLFHVAVARWIARDKCRSPSWPSKQARRGCCSRIRNVFARREAGRDAALGGLDRD